MKHPKVKVIVMHGGYNTYIDAILMQKAMLAYPLHGADQEGMCEVIHLRRVGKCLFEMSKEHFGKAMHSIERNDFFKENLYHYSRILKEKATD